MSTCSLLSVRDWRKRENYVKHDICHGIKLVSLLFLSQQTRLVPVLQYLTQPPHIIVLTSDSAMHQVRGNSCILAKIAKVSAVLLSAKRAVTSPFSQIIKGSRKRM